MFVDEYIWWRVLNPLSNILYFFEIIKEYIFKYFFGLGDKNEKKPHLNGKEEIEKMTGS